MRVVPDGEARTYEVARFEPKHDAPVYKGAGDTDYLCGSCGALLLESIDATQWREVLVRCRCGATNAFIP